MRNLHLGLYTPNQEVPKHSGSLFHSTRATTEKKKILEEEFGVAMNEELEREVFVMCNLSQGVKAEGREEGINIGEMRMLVQLVRDGDLKIERAAEKAKMTVEQFKKMMEGILEVVEVDVDQENALAEFYTIESTPTFILMRKGEQLWRQSGELSLERLERAVKEFKS